MPGLCKITAIGNLGRDPEKRYTADGRPVTRFSVAATTRKKDRDEWVDHTEWLSVTVFGARAETLAEQLAKGTRVYVEGRLESRQYESANGNKGFSLDVIANEVIIIDSRRTADAASDDDAPVAVPSRAPARATAPADPAPDESPDLESLPF